MRARRAPHNEDRRTQSALWVARPVPTKSCNCTWRVARACVKARAWAQESGLSSSARGGHEIRGGKKLKEESNWPKVLELHLA